MIQEKNIALLGEPVITNMIREFVKEEMRNYKISFESSEAPRSQEKIEQTIEQIISSHPNITIFGNYDGYERLIEKYLKTPELVTIPVIVASGYEERQINPSRTFIYLEKPHILNKLKSTIEETIALDKEIYKLMFS